MAFHIDIIPAVHIPTGKVDWHYEVGYTIQDCVDQSWLDPMVPGGLWTRKEIDRSFDPEDEEHAQEYRSHPRPGVWQEPGVEPEARRWPVGPRRGYALSEVEVVDA